MGIILHEGEYCRTKSGFIAKLIEIDDDGLCWFDGAITESGGETYNLLYPDEIDEVRKHYKDIINLIEVGDYINGLKVIELEKTGGEVTWIDIGGLVDLITYNEDIKNIITKERMQKIIYEVKEED